MKRLLIAVGLAGLVCWATRHITERKPVGGLRCTTCKRPFADMEEAGQIDDGHVREGRAWSREHRGSLHRSAVWSPGLDQRARAWEGQ